MSYAVDVNKPKGYAGTGRPTTYKEEYCNQLIDHMSQGKSVESFAGTIGVSKQCIYEWFAKHPEFGDAKRRGEAASYAWWEAEGMRGLWGSKDAFFNAQVYRLHMTNRFGWRDKVDVQQHSTVEIDHKPITAKEIKDIIQSDPFIKITEVKQIECNDDKQSMDNNGATQDGSDRPEGDEYAEHGHGD